MSPASSYLPSLAKTKSWVSFQERIYTVHYVGAAEGNMESPCSNLIPIMVSPERSRMGQGVSQTGRQHPAGVEQNEVEQFR